MTARSARRSASVLMYAAIQFVVLTLVAMKLYPGGSYTDPWATSYELGGNFFSDLGATRTWAGRSNHASMVLFSIALASIGLGFIGFARAWRAYAFDRQRAKAAGIASQWFGTLSGLAFIVVACAPVNLALNLHNTAVVAAFGLLLGYALSTTILWAYNGAPRVRLATSIVYLALVCAYVVLVVDAVRTGVGTPRGVRLLIVTQKGMVYVSIVYVLYVTIAVRKSLAARA